MCYIKKKKSQALSKYAMFCKNISKDIFTKALEDDQRLAFW